MKRVLYGGAFDLFHLAHLLAIKRASEYGYLIVNVSSDKQIRKKKGNERPIIPEHDRIRMLQELHEVDEVICMDTDELDLIALLMLTKPDILITNEDNDSYDKICRERGIEVVKLPRIIPLSNLDTTNIIKKIKGGN